MNVWDKLMNQHGSRTSRVRVPGQVQHHRIHPHSISRPAPLHIRRKSGGRTGVARIQPQPLGSPIVIGGGRAEAATGFTPTGGGGMVTAIAVTYNTRLLVEKSYQSIRRFYPDMPIIIVDGSDPGNSTAPYVRSLASPLTTVMSFGHDVNHGPGMNVGINYCQTRYALLFDTDAELLEPCVGDMLAMMEEDTFGVGFVIPTAFNGFGTWFPTPWRKEAWHPNATPPPSKGGWMPYLHPYFQLIDIKNYRKFPPYVDGGAPCTPTMLAIYQQGLSNKIIKQFKDMVNGVPKFVKHDGGGTCRRDPRVCT